MNDDNVVELRKPAETVEDALVCVLRRGAQELLARAVEEEAKIFLESYAELVGEKGQRQLCATATCLKEASKRELVLSL